MPIPKTEFCDNGVVPSTGKSVRIQRLIMNYLYEHKDSAYTTRELSDILRLNKPSVNSCLIQLDKDGITSRRKAGSWYYNCWVTSKTPDEIIGAGYIPENSPPQSKGDEKEDI